MVSIPSQEIPSIETKYGEVEASPENNALAAIIGRDQMEAHVAWVMLRLRMGYEETIQATLSRYMQTLRMFEQARGISGNVSYSVIEIAKLEIADAVLEELQFPTEPKLPDFAKGLVAPGIYKKAKIPMALRWQVWERDNFTCQACGARRLLTVDHIIAEVKGGTLELTNLQTLCGSCNSRKGDR